MLHAAITASEAARLEEAARKVPAEEEAHTRGRAGIGAANVYAKGDSYYIPNLPNTRSQPNMTQQLLLAAQTYIFKNNGPV